MLGHYRIEPLGYVSEGGAARASRAGNISGIKALFARDVNSLVAIGDIGDSTIMSRAFLKPFFK